MRAGYEITHVMTTLDGESFTTGAYNVWTDDGDTHVGRVRPLRGDLCWLVRSVDDAGKLGPTWDRSFASIELAVDALADGWRS